MCYWKIGIILRKYCLDTQIMDWREDIGRKSQYARIPDNEAAGLKSLDIPSLLGIVGLVWHQFDTTYEQNGFTESKELSVWDSSFFRILFMKKFQAKHFFLS